VAKYITKLAENGSGVLLVTHYARILNYARPHRVSVIVNGRLVESGGPEIADMLEREGYARYGGEEA